jgi:hypothetical protein
MLILLEIISVNSNIIGELMHSSNTRKKYSGTAHKLFMKFKRSL